MLTDTMANAMGYTSKRKPLPKIYKCPFCRSTKVAAMEDLQCWVECCNKKCGAEGPIRKTLRGAIIAWNVASVRVQLAGY